MATAGTLRLTIVEAELTRDVGTADDLKMDPYVVIRNRSNAMRTDTKWDAGKTPTWNETLEVQVGNISDDLELRVMDENEATNAEIGSCTVKMASMCVSGGLDDWFQIQFGGKRAGRIHLSGDWIASGSDPVAFSASRSPGLQQTISQQAAIDMQRSGMKPQQSAAYTMPKYGFQQPTQMSAPAWQDRQF